MDIIDHCEVELEKMKSHYLKLISKLEDSDQLMERAHQLFFKTIRTYGRGYALLKVKITQMLEY
ncbi:MAG: hypothetical protein ISR65_15705 [Bacteriovoracaceae bacterium]|nr:hypothetical protein [Bacteriovoracaceae bacterium]